MEMRFDTTPLRATSTAEGYLRDSPILTRVGIFPYKRQDGTTRYELRPPEEVFHADTLASLKGIPITDGHPGLVNSRNAKQHSVGTVLSEGRQDGENTVGDIVIHDTSPIVAGKKELSCGYTLTLDETPGEWNGQRYDAVQRNIRYNHTALVRAGRAGNARLNLDAADADLSNDEESNMTTVKVRLDSGLSYDAAPEVAQELEALRGKIGDATKRADEQQARADSEKARADEAVAKIDQARKDGQAVAHARLKLEGEAKALGVEVKQDMADKDIRVAVIKAVRGDGFDVAGKSDAYLEVAYDLAVGEKASRTDALSSQRREMFQKVKQDGNEGDGGGSVSAAAARAKMISGMNGGQ
ncbi:DUF2213 domain-containing protein [Cupriavidus alkaliphilus]|uniref:DUF2213 domain-containing protein n=1 Tax=Cupriavidus alkaliphilus TaxID=942866 RepID=UPI0016088593|nr:DUF2213 domain-containing protein [Cupriavidus alkaliphilus]MBB2918324.1 hypothetical protein [Cupriavidus alkaliphilus]